MDDKTALLAAIEVILQGFPSLSVYNQNGTDDEVLILLQGSGPSTENDIVGTYSVEAFRGKQLSESDIREDCEEFCRERGV